jgi:hypothetical protein
VFLSRENFTNILITIVVIINTEAVTSVFGKAEPEYWVIETDFCKFAHILTFLITGTAGVM